MIDVAENPRAVVGGNSPPPHELFAEEIDCLFTEAGNWLDGSGVNTDAEAEAVSKLIDMLRRASKDADTQRAAEKKPHDDAAKAVQARWKPLIDKATLAIDVAKKALTPFLERKEAEQRAEAERLRLAAEDAARKAREAHQASQSDLAAAGNAKVLETAAAALNKAAEKADKAKAHATGGERAIGLRSRWDTVLVDPVAALKHYRAAQPDSLKQWLLEQAEADVRSGKRALPGFQITERKIAA